MVHIRPALTGRLMDGNVPCGQVQKDSADQMTILHHLPRGDILRQSDLHIEDPVSWLMSAVADAGHPRQDLAHDGARLFVEPLATVLSVKNDSGGFAPPDLNRHLQDFCRSYDPAYWHVHSPSEWWGTGMNEV